MNQEKVAFQRAAMMGILTAVIQDEESTADEIRQKVVSGIARFIDMDLIVGDFIEQIMMMEAKTYCEKERMVEQAKNIVNENQ